MKSINDLPKWFMEREDSLEILFDLYEQHSAEPSAILGKFNKVRYIVCSKSRLYSDSVEFAIDWFDSMNDIKKYFNDEVEMNNIESIHFIYDQQKEMYIELKITKTIEVIELGKEK